MGDPVAPAPPVDAAAAQQAAPAPSVPRLTQCDRPLPIAGRPQGFRHTGSRLTAHPSVAQHRGQDVFVREGAAQVVTAKFAYDIGDRDLQDEDVDVFVLRDCRRWEPLGPARTSRNGAPVAMSDGSVDRSGGRASVRIPDDRRLGRGMHRVRFVVRGDHTWADAIVNVIDANARFVVSDVDGTLTEAEYANLAYVTGFRRREPGPNPGAAAALAAAARAGYQVMYLTGRPDWTAGLTHAWLSRHGFPQGVVRTRPNTVFGLTGPDTAVFKTEQLRATERLFGRRASYAFGNSVVDVAAYRNAGIDASRRFFYRFAGDTSGGVAHSDYFGVALRIAASGPSEVASLAR